MIAIKLENNLECNSICKTIQKCINRYNRENTINSDRYLIIKIQEVVEADNLKKIEYKNEI